MRLGYSPTQGFNLKKFSGFNLFQMETTQKTHNKNGTIPGETKRGGQRKAKKRTALKAQKEGSYLTKNEELSHSWPL